MAIPTHYLALSRYLGDHVNAEEAALQGYEKLLEGRPEDVATYLMTMILSDEARHHQIFADMRETLDSRIEWREGDSTIPPLIVDGSIPALLAATDELLRLEMADVRELRKLRRAWRRSRGERKTWALLVETARLDTKKHIRILKHLRGILREAR